MKKLPIKLNVMKMNYDIKVLYLIEVLYLIVLFVYSFWQILASSLLYFYTTHLILQAGMIIVLGVMLFLRSRLSIKGVILGTVLLIVMSISAYKTDRLYLFIGALLIVNSFDIDFKKEVFISMLASFSSVFFIVLASSAGVIPNRTFYRDAGIAKCFGFIYYSSYPYIALYFMLGYMYLKKKMNWFEIIVCVLLNSYIYKVSTLRLTYYLSLIVIVMYILLVKMDMIKITGQLMRRIAVISFPLAFVMTVMCALKYTNQSRVWRAMDKVVSSRISLSREGFNRYSVKLFGQYIDTVTMKNGIFLPNYFYIDSGYIYSLLGYGILFSVLITASYSLIFYYSTKKNDRVLFIWCFSVLIFSIVNNTWVNLNINCVLLLVLPTLKSVFYKRNSYLRLENLKNFCSNS